MKEKKEMREKLDVEIQELELFLRNVNAKVEQERHFKEEALGTSYITPREWDEKHQEA